jgi:hypothetical protein
MYEITQKPHEGATYSQIIYNAIYCDTIWVQTKVWSYLYLENV